jgi:hypothetical protein
VEWSGVEWCGVVLHVKWIQLTVGQTGLMCAAAGRVWVNRDRTVGVGWVLTGLLVLTGDRLGIDRTVGTGWGQAGY